MFKAERFPAMAPGLYVLDVQARGFEPYEEAIATDNLFSPNFGQPSAFVDPRRAMFGVRLNLGR